jgi:hypothetical protein
MGPILCYMALLRFISASLEFLAAILFLKLNSVETAIRVNALVGLVGQFVFIGVSFLGLVGMADASSSLKLLIIAAGVLLILIGTSLK